MPCVWSVYESDCGSDIQECFRHTLLNLKDIEICESCFNAEDMNKLLWIQKDQILASLYKNGKLFELTEIEKVSLMFVLANCSDGRHVDCVKSFVAEFWTESLTLIRQR